MSELDEIRKTYPQYKDWNDRDLADALKDKYYPDMSDEEYYPQLGLDPNPGFAGVGSDILEGVKNLRHLPSALGHTISQAPSEIKGVLEMSPKRFGQNVAAGLGELGRGFINIPGNIVDYGKRKEILPEWLPDLTPNEEFQNINYAKDVGLNNTQPGDALARFLPEAGFYAAGGELGGGGRLLRNLKRGGSFATEAISHNNNPVTALAAPFAFDILGKLLSKSGEITGKALNRNVNKIATQAEELLTPEELARNVRAARNTNTDIGNVIGSPELAHEFSNEIMPQAKKPVVDKIMREREQQVQNRAEEVGNLAAQGKLVKSDLNPVVESLTKQAAKESAFVKNELYKPVSDLAKKEGVNLELPSFTNLLNKHIDHIENSPLLRADKDFAAQLNRLKNLGVKDKETITKGAIVDEFGNPLMETKTTQSSTIADAKAVLNKLYDEGQKMTKSNNSYDINTGELYKKLATSGRNDIKNLIKDKGSPDLNNAFNTAEEHYKSDFSRFLNKDVRKLLDETKDYDSIVHDIIKPSVVKDKYSLIEKVIDILPKGQKHLLGATYLQKAFDEYGVLQPKELANLWNKLGPRQQKALFPDVAIRESIRDFINLKNMNADALNKWFNPKTGAKNQGMIAQLMEATKGSGPGGAIGAVIGGSLLGPFGAAAGGFAGGVAGKALRKKNYTRLAKQYTSPEFRQKILEKMQKNANKNKSNFSANEFGKILKEMSKTLTSVESANIQGEE